MLWCIGLLVERDEKYGGNVKFVVYEEMEAAYAKEVSCMVPVNGSYHLVILLHCTTQAIYPLDLKNTVLAYLNKVVGICVQYVCVRGRFVAVLITYFLLFIHLLFML